MQKVCTKRVCLTSLHCKHKILLPSCCLCPWDISPVYRDALCAIPWESLAFWIPNPISLSCCLLLYFSKNIFVVFTFIKNCFLGQCLLVSTFEPLILVLFEKWKKVSLLHTEGRRASALWEGSQRSCSGVFDNYQGQFFYCLSCAG